MDYDYFVYKGVEADAHPYGACYHTLNWKSNKKSTGVIEVLKLLGVVNVIVGGLATDYCVKNTALQLADANFRVYLNLKSSRGISEDTVTAALEEMKEAGVIIINDLSKIIVS
jgi:nicotinamidase/pyrazinamidase